MSNYTYRDYCFLVMIIILLLYAVQDMAFKEQVRQQEEDMKKSEEEVQRKHNLQYALIALALVTFVIIFFLFSHSIVANQNSFAS